MSKQPTPIASPLLRLPDLMAYLKIGRPSVYMLRDEDPTFPQPIRVTPRTIAWKKAEIDEWLADRPRATPDSDAQQAAAA